MEKKAFVLDTNFIIENLNLKEVVDNLSEDFTVYVTQVSIDERVSQKFIDLKSKFDRLSSLCNEYRGIATISLTTSLEKRFEYEKAQTQKGYEDLFGQHIIPFTPDNFTFSKVLDRAYKKYPPFLSVEGASDKGFKDSLIWISLLDFFQNTGEAEIIFVTSDKGFKKSETELCREFFATTKKSIIFKDNSYYKTLFESKEITPAFQKKPTVLPDVKQLREKVQDIITNMCGIEGEDYWGNPEWQKTFALSQYVDAAYMESVFSSLKQKISDNLFEASMPAKDVFEIDNRIKNILPIPTSRLEDALLLYEDIQQRLPDYLPQFYNAAAKVLNNNYEEPFLIEDLDNLPF